jgi:hypothetical protein
MPMRESGAMSTPEIIPARECDCAMPFSGGERFVVIASLFRTKLTEKAAMSPENGMYA